MRGLVLGMALVPNVGIAEFQAMTGAQIEAALSGRALVYDDGATQDFRPSGRTLYHAGRPSWGYWAARGDAYCSQWPPSDGWFCYDMAREGEVLRFIAQDGSFTDGTYSD